MQQKPYSGFEVVWSKSDVRARHIDAKPVIGDAYGFLIRDAFETDSGHSSNAHVYEYDDGLIVVRDVEYMFRPPADWSPGDLWALDRAEGDCLDIAMGAGRVSLALQERNLWAKGIDQSAGAVEVARERGVKAASVCDISDIGSNLQPATYDTVFMLGMGLGLLGAPARAPGILRALHAVTAPGARILGEGSMPVAPDRPRNIDYLEWNRNRGWQPGQSMHRMRYRRWSTPWMPLWFAEQEELAKFVEPHGWRMGELFTTGAMSYVAEFHRLDI